MKEYIDGGTERNIHWAKGVLVRTGRVAVDMIVLGVCLIEF